MGVSHASLGSAPAWRAPLGMGASSRLALSFLSHISLVVRPEHEAHTWAFHTLGGVASRGRQGPPCAPLRWRAPFFTWCALSGSMQLDVPLSGLRVWRSEESAVLRALVKRGNHDQTEQAGA